MNKLQQDYYATSNVWPGCELLLAVFSMGGRIHDSLQSALRGWCFRAADRQHGQGALAATILGGALLRRAYGVLGIALHREVHRLAYSQTRAGTFVTKRDAGPTELWETAVGAAAAMPNID